MKNLIYLLILSSIGLTSSCQRPIHKDEKPSHASHPLPSNDRELNPNGSLFYAERVKDTYIENVGQVATYRFIARKFPPETKYLLCSQNLGSPLQPITWYDVDDDGQLGRQIEAGTLMLDNELILMFDYCRGEPVEYWLCSSDGNARLCSSFVPYPILAEGRDGATISLRRLTRDAGLVIVEGSDFNPDEAIMVSSQTGTIAAPSVPVVCGYGKFSMIFEPSAPGKTGGVAYVDVMRKGERLTLEYDWGCEAVNPKRRLGNTSRIKQDALLNLPTDL